MSQKVLKIFNWRFVSLVLGSRIFWKCDFLFILTHYVLKLKLGLIYKLFFNSKCFKIKWFSNQSVQMISKCFPWNKFYKIHIWVYESIHILTCLQTSVKLWMNRFMTKSFESKFDLIKMKVWQSGWINSLPLACKIESIPKSIQQ